MTDYQSTQPRTTPYFGYSRIKEILGRAREFDRVVLAFFAILAALAIWTPAALWPSVRFTAQSLLEIAPFLLISILLAAYLGASGADRLIGAAFRGKARQAVMLAAIVGAFSPFCSCGVIPLIAALLASGVPLAPVMAFWLASPIMDPEMFILVAATLGIEFALVKTAAAVALGALGGMAVLMLERAGHLDAPLKIAVSGCGGNAVTATERPVWSFFGDPDRRSVFGREAWRNGLFLTRWLTLAFLLEALMLRWVPADQLGAWLADLGTFSILAAAVVGVPAYLNGYAAIPTTDALMQLGLSAPAGLTFMVAGGVTSIPAAVAVHAMVKPRVFGLYVLVALTGSCLVGFAYLAYKLTGL